MVLFGVLVRSFLRLMCSTEREMPYVVGDVDVQ